MQLHLRGLPVQETGMRGTQFRQARAQQLLQPHGRQRHTEAGVQLPLRAHMEYRLEERVLLALRQGVSTLKNYIIKICCRKLSLVLP